MGLSRFMTPGNWIAIAAIVVAVMIPVVAALFAHIRHDERRNERLTQVEKEIGSHETGIRGSVHSHTNTLTWLGGCLWFMANKLGIELPKREK